MASRKHGQLFWVYIRRLAGISFILALLAFQISSSSLFHVHAVRLTDRRLDLSTSVVGATNVTYLFSFGITTPASLGSVELELCTNDPFPLTPCTAPAGLDMTGAILSNQTGEVGFSIDASSTANKIVLTRAPSASTVQPVSFTFTGITNPTLVATYYVRLVTFASNDATGPFTDYGGIAWATTNNFNVNGEVPPYLHFCTGVTIPTYDCGTATGSNIDFGNLSPSATASATSQFLAATNAAFGFNVSIYGVTMTSGSNTIPALATQTFAAPGNGQFGINARANTIPAKGSDPSGPGTAILDPNYATPDLYRFSDGDMIASSTGTSDFRRFTATYIVNIDSAQPAGIYTTTITYVCLANF